jgi:hypothetical protein
MVKNEVFLYKEEYFICCFNIKSNIKPKEAKARLESENGIVLLDVRTE